MKITKKRLELLRELEAIIGNECYNGNIQNWGANGVFHGAGREFRYPITFIDETEGTVKRRANYDDLPNSTQATGHYKFGSNQLHIISALDKVVSRLEEKYGVKF